MKRNLYTRTLGKQSAKFISELVHSNQDIFTLDDACKIYGRSRQETSDFLRNLVNRGIIARVKSGTFLILKMGQENTQLSNWPILARTLAGTEHYFISHYSAMRLLGMTTHALANVTITITKKIKVKKVNNISYQFIYSKPEHFWGNFEHWITKHEKIQMSDLERTILDGLERPDLCGGIKEIVRGIWIKQKEIDWDKLMQYSEKYHTISAIKRLAYILDMLDIGTSYLPKFEEILSSKKDYILLDPDGPKIGKYVNHWHIRLNIDIDELKSSVWS